MSERQVELESLIGLHILSGIGRGTKNRKDVWYDGYEDMVETFSFVLDGKTYTAAQDPNDGYRSSMDFLYESNEPITNPFSGQQVLGTMREPRNGYEGGNILDLLDVVTGKRVLSVGTGNTGDYYPFWVADFTPENMAANISKGQP